MPSPQPISPRPLISRTSILILAGFLIGLSTAASFDKDLRGYLQICGLVGLISLVGLYFVAVRREQEVAERVLDQQAKKVQQLLDEYLGNVAQALRTRVQEFVGKEIGDLVGQRKADEEAKRASTRAAAVSSTSQQDR